MSRSDEKKLIGETLIRYQDRKKSLCCLETKARNMADQLTEMAGKLRSVPAPEMPHLLRHNRQNVPDMPDADEPYELMCEIQSLMVAISEDRKSLQGMGVQFPIE